SGYQQILLSRRLIVHCNRDLASVKHLACSQIQAVILRDLVSVGNRLAWARGPVNRSSRKIPAGLIPGAAVDHVAGVILDPPALVSRHLIRQAGPRYAPIRDNDLEFAPLICANLKTRGVSPAHLPDRAGWDTDLLLVRGRSG